jgi:hypothetical protein
VAEAESLGKNPKYRMTKGNAMSSIAKLSILCGFMLSVLSISLSLSAEETAPITLKTSGRDMNARRAKKEQEQLERLEQHQAAVRALEAAGYEMKYGWDVPAPYGEQSLFNIPSMDYVRNSLAGRIVVPVVAILPKHSWGSGSNYTVLEGISIEMILPFQDLRSLDLSHSHWTLDDIKQLQAFPHLQRLLLPQEMMEEKKRNQIESLLPGCELKSSTDEFAHMWINRSVFLLPEFSEASMQCVNFEGVKESIQRRKPNPKYDLEKHQEAVRELQNIDCEFLYECETQNQLNTRLPFYLPAAAYIRNSLAGRVLIPVVAMQAAEKPFDLVQLTQFEDLQYLDLSSTDLKLEDLAPLSKLTQLRTLIVPKALEQETSVKDEAMGSLKEILPHCEFKTTHKERSSSPFYWTFMFSEKHKGW